MSLSNWFRLSVWQEIFNYYLFWQNLVVVLEQKFAPRKFCHFRPRQQTNVIWTRNITPNLDLSAKQCLLAIIFYAFIWPIYRLAGLLNNISSIFKRLSQLNTTKSYRWYRISNFLSQWTKLRPNIANLQLRYAP